MRVLSELPLQLVPDAYTVFGPQVATIVVTVWLIWQVYGPKFGFETRLSPLFAVVTRVEEMERSLSSLKEQTTNIDTMQRHHIQVSRANARALDPDKNVAINSDDVDDYLVDNGVAVSELTKEPDSDDVGHANND